MKISNVDLIVIFIHLSLMAGIGLYFMRRNRSTDEYFAAGRSHGGILLGLSMVAASISSVTFIALPADSFKTAWLRFIPIFMMPLAVYVAGKFFAPLYRRTHVTSVYEYLEMRFGPTVRVYAALMFAAGQVIRLSIVLFLLSVIVWTLTGISPEVCILIAGIITAFYTLAGGLNAVIWTDAIQTIVLLGGALLVLGIIVYNVPGGISEIISEGLKSGKLSAADLTNGELVPTPWIGGLFGKSIFMMLIVGCVQWFTEYLSSQSVVQRYVAAKSDAQMRKSLWVSVLMNIPIWTGFMLMGTGLYVYYTHFPDPNAAKILSGELKAEEIMPLFLSTKVPVGLTGLIVAGIMAAAMSTLASSMNAFASVLTTDVYKRCFFPGKSNRHYLIAGWVFTAVAAVLMLLGAFIFLKSDTKTMAEVSTVGTAITAAGLLGVFLLGFFSRRATQGSIILGMVFSLALTVWYLLTVLGHLPDWLAYPFDYYYIGILGNLLMIVVGYFCGSLFKRRHVDADLKLTIWDKPSDSK